jgi:hypothetical protein
MYFYKVLYIRVHNGHCLKWAMFITGIESRHCKYKCNKKRDLEMFNVIITYFKCHLHPTEKAWRCIYVLKFKFWSRFFNPSSKPLNTNMHLIIYFFGRHVSMCSSRPQRTISQTVQKTSRAEVWRIFHQIKGASE